MDEVISEWEKRRYVPKPGEPELPPQLSGMADKTADDIIKELNRLPFFMTELDETDGGEGENTTLEALKSLAYDGEPDEIATNFKNQGNDCYKAKDYHNAIAYYTKGLEVEHGIDSLTCALLANRAACNLELKNYRRCIEDCKKVLQIDAKNSKATFRAGKAFFAIEKYDEAIQILNYGLTFDPENKQISDLITEINNKVEKINQLKIQREKEAEKKRLKAIILENSIKLRHYTMIKTSKPYMADMLEGTEIKLEDETDHESQLIFPAIIIYPTIKEFDFVKEVSELVTPLELLEQVLHREREWYEDPKHKNFTVKKLECYMETESGGLIKVGKKVALNDVLMAEKPNVPLFDNSLRIYVVPKADSAEWLSQWNKQEALATRQ